jgi:hypothetical protein
VGDNGHSNILHTAHAAFLTVRSSYSCIVQNLGPVDEVDSARKVDEREYNYGWDF